MSGPSLNGGKTRPLSPHAHEVLEWLRRGPLPRQELNPGTADRLLRGGLVTSVQLPSPYAAHKGGSCEHLRLVESLR